MIWLLGSLVVLFIVLPALILMSVARDAIETAHDTNREIFNHWFKS